MYDMSATAYTVPQPSLNSAQIGTMPKEPSVEQRLQETLGYLLELGNIVDGMLHQGQSDPQPSPSPEGIIQTAAVVCQQAASLGGAIKTLSARLGRV